MYDIIIDVVVNGRVVLPEHIPQAVSEQIAVIQKRLENGLEIGIESGQIEYGGVCYQWSLRPCVYP